MSSYNIVASAIKSAIQVGDPSCPAANIHTYFRQPKGTTYDDIFALLGQTLANNDKRFHGWMLRRQASPQQEVLGFSSDETLINEYEDWKVFGFYSVDDNANSEEVFQIICDTVKAELRTATAVLDLERNYDIVVETVSLVNFDNGFISGRNLAHIAQLVLRLRLSNQVV